MPNRLKKILPLLTIVLVLAAFFVGWFLRENKKTGGSLGENTYGGLIQVEPLRLEGYSFISPLLVCDVGEQKPFPELQKLKTDIQAVVDLGTARGDITTASVYFQNLESGHWLATNEHETFYPSSLGKLPLMIAYLKISETQPDLLNEKIRYNGGEDLNQRQEIYPEDSLIEGTSYTIGELLYRMIKYSDNNAAKLLFDRADQKAVRRVYDDLGVPVNDAVNIEDLDFITAKQYSLFLRILYNATYLSREESEVILRVLGDTTFRNGLVAGIPATTKVAHKFGLVGIAPQGIVESRELHDCGIIYRPATPYLLCVMTKSSSTLQNNEKTIADISRAVYEVVEKDFK